MGSCAAKSCRALLSYYARGREVAVGGLAGLKGAPRVLIE
jgi:hypothetical protein